MPVLAPNASEYFAFSLANAGNCTWVLSFEQHRGAGDLHLVTWGCAQGTATSSGLHPTFSRFAGLTPPPGGGQYTRELQFASCHNNGTGDQVVSLGKIAVVTSGTGSAYYQFSPQVTLHSQETLTYVKGAGFTVFDSSGLPKSSSSHS